MSLKHRWIWSWNYVSTGKLLILSLAISNNESSSQLNKTLITMAKILCVTSQSHLPKSKPPSNPFCEQSSRRTFLSVSTTLMPLLVHPPNLIAQTTSPSTKTILSGITSTKSWFRYYGDGFAIRVPPDFQDIMEPEVGHSLSFFSLPLLSFSIIYRKLLMVCYFFI